MKEKEYVIKGGQDDLFQRKREHHGNYNKRYNITDATYITGFTRF